MAREFYAGKPKFKENAVAECSARSCMALMESDSDVSRVNLYLSQSPEEQILKIEDFYQDTLESFSVILSENRGTMPHQIHYLSNWLASYYSEENEFGKEYIENTFRRAVSETILSTFVEQSHYLEPNRDRSTVSINGKNLLVTFEYFLYNPEENSIPGMEVEEGAVIYLDLEQNIKPSDSDKFLEVMESDIEIKVEHEEIDHVLNDLRIINKISHLRSLLQRFDFEKYMQIVDIAESSTDDLSEVISRTTDFLLDIGREDLHGYTGIIRDLYLEISELNTQDTAAKDQILEKIEKMQVIDFNLEEGSKAESRKIDNIHFKVLAEIVFSDSPKSESEDALRVLSEQLKQGKFVNLNDIIERLEEVITSPTSNEHIDQSEAEMMIKKLRNLRSNLSVMTRNQRQMYYDLTFEMNKADLEASMWTDRSLFMKQFQEKMPILSNKPMPDLDKEWEYIRFEASKNNRRVNREEIYELLGVEYQRVSDVLIVLGSYEEMTLLGHLNAMTEDLQNFLVSDLLEEDQIEKRFVNYFKDLGLYRKYLEILGYSRLLHRIEYIMKQVDYK